ncbi:MAG: radical SAM protein [Candidatus Pacebacteria bacterium]|nr:radical SAM protein [Candidatus Paceibacterota bacterium]
MKRLSSPLDVQIELTERCNQVCRHCYNYWRQGTLSSVGELNIDQFMNIIRQIYLAKVGTVTLTGGEPMLRKSLLFDMISELHRLDIDVGLNSNGVLIEKDDAVILAKNGLKHSLISVLGPEKIHNLIAGPGGNFIKTIDGIKKLLDAGIDVAVNMPVSKISLPYLWDTAFLIKNIGVKKFCSGPIIPSCKQNISLCLSAEECKTCLRDLIKIDSELSLEIDVLEPLVRCLFKPEEEIEFVRFFGNRMIMGSVTILYI